MPRRVYLASLLLAVCGLLPACTALQIQPPDVVLAGLHMLPSQGMEPRFEVRLRLINPNDSDLRFKGGSFRLHVQGSRVATGVVQRPDPVPAFGESLLVAQASGDILGGIALVRKLMQGTGGHLAYRVELSLQREGSLFPLNVTRSGDFELPTESGDKE